jgi:hypothetical protein
VPLDELDRARRAEVADGVWKELVRRVTAKQP